MHCTVQTQILLLSRSVYVIKPLKPNLDHGGFNSHVGLGYFSEFLLHLISCCFIFKTKPTLSIVETFLDIVPCLPTGRF